MLPELSKYTCTLRWTGDNTDYSNFSRLHGIEFPGGTAIKGSGAQLREGQTNPEELFAAAVGTCMMMTILAVFSKSQIKVTEYEDHPEAILELTERRYRITKVLLKPRIVVDKPVPAEKLQTLIEKSHANCFISLSVKSEVLVEPTLEVVP